MQVARYDEDTATENIGKDECADFVEVKVKAKTRLFKASGDSGGVPCSLLRQQSASVKSRKRPLRSRLPPGPRAKSAPVNLKKGKVRACGFTGDSSGGEEESGDWRCSVFVSHIPISVTKEEIGMMFGRFGKVEKTIIPGKQFRQQHISYAAALTDPSAYAFIYFSEPSAVEAAVAAPPIEMAPGVALHVERRRDPKSKRSSSGSPQPGIKS